MEKTIKMTILVYILLLGYSNVLYSQESNQADSTLLKEIHNQEWKTLIGDILENTENEESAEKWEEILSELAENPIALNTATKETLESIPFLSDAQVEALSYYIYRYGPLSSLSELLLVEGMDDQTLRWLTPFVCLGKPTAFPIERPSLKKALKYGKQEINWRMGRSIQDKLGYADATDSTKSDNRYLGDPTQINLRYGFNYKEKMQWGFVLQKDAGEKTWNKGIDYASFHFLLKDQKRIKSLIIGDYNLRFGQGLVCASAFSLGKSVNGTALEQTGTNLSRHFSSSESGFFRGIAATFILKPFVRQTSQTKGKFGLEMTAFGSTKNLDANVENDAFSTISSGELHRTEREASLNDKLRLNTIGAHLTIRTDKSQIGFTGLTYGFNANFSPEWKPYNCFYFRGKYGGNLSVDYRFRYKGILFFGEFSSDEKLKNAFLTGISLKPYSSLDLSFLGRNYAPEYNAYFSNAFSEGTSTRNEYGFFATIEWRFVKKWRINAYYDVFRFPWLKYGVNTPSSGFDYTIQTTWLTSSTSQVVIRLKSKKKDINVNKDEEVFSFIETQIKNQIRFQVSSIQGNWSLKTVLDGNDIGMINAEKKTVGFAASQEIGYNPKASSVSFSMRYALFDTELFENRIYSYERDIPGVFSMTSFYGKGSRFSLLVKYKFSKTVSTQIKLGHTSYRDRQQVGTALEQVEGNQLTDIRGMILWKF